MDASEATSACRLLNLLDWRRRVFDLYRVIRASTDAAAAHAHWREVRAEMFRSHSQSPIPEPARAAFRALPTFGYDPSARVLAEVEEAQPEEISITTGDGDAPYNFTRFARASFVLEGRRLSVALYWLHGYAGGVFLPFADRTSGASTYGAGRYLLDTAKGADLGTERGRLVLDFNFAYQPSCSYDPRWVCPLAPGENRLPIAIEAGERLSPERPVGATMMA